MSNIQTDVVVWTGSDDNIKPVIFDIFTHVSIKQVSIGCTHFLFLDQNGCVYSSGQNDYGQLGLGADVSYVEQPVDVNLKGKVVSKVGCGHYHSAVLCSDGHLFMCGYNSDGQCGLGHTDDEYCFSNVTFNEIGQDTIVHNDEMSLESTNTEITEIACGKSHSLAVSNRNVLWAWGSGPQTGLGCDCLKQSVPAIIPNLKDHKTISISCGESHSLALVAKETLTFSMNSSTSGSFSSNPVTCSQCNGEMFNLTDSGDTCIITHGHHCMLDDEPELQSSSEIFGCNVNISSHSHVSTCKCDSNITVIQTETAENAGYISRESVENSETNDVSSINNSIYQLYSPESPSSYLDKRDLSFGKIKSSFVDVQKSVMKYAKDFSSFMSFSSVSSQPSLDSDSETKMREDNSFHECVAQDHSADDNFTQNSNLEKSKDTDEFNNKNSVNQKFESPCSCSSSQVDAKHTDFDDVVFSTETDTNRLNIQGSVELTHIIDSEVSANESLPVFDSSKDCQRTSSKNMFDEKEALEFLEKQLDNSIPGNDDRVLDNPSDDKYLFLTGETSVYKQAVNESIKQTVKGETATPENVEMVRQDSKLDSTTSAQNPQLDVSNLLMNETFTDLYYDLEFLPMSEDLHAGGLLRSSGPTRRKDHLRRRNSRGKSLKEIPESTNNNCTINTSVWSWGHNNNGQLGLGHFDHVTEPIQIKAFKGRNVVRVVAGSEHSVALTADNQVYMWRHTSPLTSSQPTPSKIKSLLGSPVLNIASGKNHSLFLVDTSGFQPEVFYTQQLPKSDERSSTSSQFHSNQPKKLSFLRKHGRVCSISSFGDTCAAIVHTNNLELSATQFEYFLSEVKFYRRLKKTFSHFLMPLKKAEFYVPGEPTLSNYRQCFHNLISTFGQISNIIGCHSQELNNHMQFCDDILHTSTFNTDNPFMSVISRFSKELCDLISVNGISVTVKNSSHFLQKTTSVICDIFEMDKGNSFPPQEAILNCLQLPILRISEYLKLCNKMIMHYSEESSDYKRISEFIEKLEVMKYDLRQEQIEAENTRSFWDSCNSKISDSLCTVGRRLIRDSKSHPLFLHGSLRISSHYFFLFNDIFVHMQANSIRDFPVTMMWVEAVVEVEIQDAILVVTPEDTMTLTTPSAAEKADWIGIFNRVINMALPNTVPLRERVTPPLARQGKFQFQKHPQFKDATYSGKWFNGVMHGQGEMEWPDGKKYIGQFKNGLQHGYGISITPCSEAVEIYEGSWKEGLYHGYGSIRYANGSLYDGYFKKGLRFGFGTFKHGRIGLSSSLYIGEWSHDVRHGYGVSDDVQKGEKYMGMWEDGIRHGNGILVTLDGMYFEGSFVNDKLTGFGLMITDDNSYYEGDFNGITQLFGKGCLTLPGGDYIQGHFNGSWNDGLKINGTFHKVVPQLNTKEYEPKPKYYGEFSVPAARKWMDIFSHCCSMMGYTGPDVSATKRAWEMVAIVMSSRKISGKNAPREKKLSKSSFNSQEVLEKIPRHDLGALTHEYYREIKTYLSQAFNTVKHPLGKLLLNLVDVFRATYIGIAAHPRLLHHARLEVHSYIKRVYLIVRILFPDLPKNGGPKLLWTTSELENVSKEGRDESRERKLSNASYTEIFTSGQLLYPILLPHIYPTLFDLYALFCYRDDEKYWQQIKKLNRQSDITLLAYLGVNEKFWTIPNHPKPEQKQNISHIKDKCYHSSVDSLQQLSSEFSPTDKLKVIEQSFKEISQEVARHVGGTHMWCMDELFPIFQYVVVRSRIHHLGAEIHLIEDFMDEHLQHGELGIMITTLKACYFQIQTENISVS